MGEPLLIYRIGSNSSDSNIVVLEDSCCHRHTPLSAGRREGDAVRCGYHGLLFNGDGACVEVPGLDKVPPKVCGRRYPAAVHNKWVMAWMGDAQRADPALLPDNFSCDDPGLALSAGLSALRNALGTDRRQFAGLLALELCACRHAADALGRTPAGAAQDDESVGVRFHSCQALTPETAESTHNFFQESHRAEHGGPDTTQRICDGLLAAFLEDRQMIGAQWHNMALPTDRPMLPLAMDAALKMFRRKLQAAVDSEASAAVAASTP
jgi:nitrite reductase/ring-hydroxylating ferredoxin subunit